MSNKFINVTYWDWNFDAQTFQWCNPFFIYSVALEDMSSLHGTGICLPTDTKETNLYKYRMFEKHTASKRIIRF